MHQIVVQSVERNIPKPSVVKNQVPYINKICELTIDKHCGQQILIRCKALDLNILNIVTRFTSGGETVPISLSGNTKSARNMTTVYSTYNDVSSTLPAETENMTTTTTKPTGPYSNSSTTTTTTGIYMKLNWTVSWI